MARLAVMCNGQKEILYFESRKVKKAWMETNGVEKRKQDIDQAIIEEFISDCKNSGAKVGMYNFDDMDEITANTYVNRQLGKKWNGELISNNYLFSVKDDKKSTLNRLSKKLGVDTDTIVKANQDISAHNARPEDTRAPWKNVELDKDTVLSSLKSKQNWFYRAAQDIGEFFGNITHSIAKNAEAKNDTSED